jgi:hypothetical protein
MSPSSNRTAVRTGVLNGPIRLRFYDVWHADNRAADLTRMYRSVWSKPVGSVAKELGISGRGLAKICARFEIPVPPRGYWAKLAAAKHTPENSFASDRLQTSLRNPDCYSRLRSGGHDPTVKADCRTVFTGGTQWSLYDSSPSLPRVPAFHPLPVT